MRVFKLVDCSQDTGSVFSQALKSYIKRHPDAVLFSFIFINALGFWAFAYGFGVNNVLFSHDGLIIDSSADANWEIGQGRFLQIAYWQLRGTIAAPMLVHGLAVVWLSLSCYLTIKLLGLYKPLLILFTVGILAVNPANTYINATYICWIDTYQLALALSLGALFVIRKLSSSHGGGRIAISALLLSCSLGLYQNYIAVFLFMTLVLFIKDLLGQRTLKESMTFLLRCLVSMAIGAIVYYIVWKLVLHFNPQVNVTSYNGFDALGDYGGISPFSLLGETYLHSFLYMGRPEGFHRTLSGILAIVIFSVAFILLVKYLVESKNRIKLVAGTLAILVLPLAIDCVYFISKGVFHSLMVGPFYFAFVSCFPLFQKMQANRRMVNPIFQVKNALYPICCICMGLVILFNTVFANDALLKKDFIYQSTDALMTRIIDRIEETDGYEPGTTPVAFIGQLRYSPLFSGRTAAFDKIEGVGFYNSSITRNSSTDQWLRIILGYTYIPASSEVRERLSVSETVAQMNAFPAEDSVRMVDGVLVVKLSTRT